MTSPKLIWIVEDHAPFRRTLAKALNTEADLCCAREYDSCEAALENLSKESAPDVLLLDVGLPGMSGHEVAKVLRSGGFTGTLIALTGYSDESDHIQSRQSGFDHHLVKPIGIADLRKVLPKFS